MVRVSLFGNGLAVLGHVTAANTENLLARLEEQSGCALCRGQQASWIVAQIQDKSAKLIPAEFLDCIAEEPGSALFEAGHPHITDPRCREISTIHAGRFNL